MRPEGDMLVLEVGRADFLVGELRFRAGTSGWHAQENSQSDRRIVLGWWDRECTVLDNQILDYSI